MSWDIFVQDLPEEASSVDEIPEDFAPKPIGQRAEIIAKILEVAPELTFVSTSLANIEGPDFSIEVAISDEGELGGFALHVRGGEHAAFLLQHLALRAIDANSPTGIFDNRNDPGKGLRRWREYRDEVVVRKK